MNNRKLPGRVPRDRGEERNIVMEGFSRTYSSNDKT